MQTIKITTSQNIDIEYPIAGLGDRIVAILIDYGIVLGVYFILSIIIDIYAAIAGYDNFTGAGYPMTILITVIVWLTLFVFYDLICEIFMNGQSFGKKIRKIKVISMNGARPRVGQYILRWLFRIVDVGITGGSVAVITVALSDNKQRLGDMVAGTAVISLNPQNNLKDFVFSPPPADYEPMYPHVAQLTDGDVVLIHDVIRNFNRTRNSMMVYKLALKLKEYLNISYDREINEYQFLEIVLNDYNSLAAKSEV
jgi:uncharacterized RDD family membrane protein YckC